MVTKWPNPLLLFPSKCMHKALATAGTLINMVHEQNKARRKADCGLKKVSKYIFPPTPPTS